MDKLNTLSAENTSETPHVVGSLRYGILPPAEGSNPVAVCCFPVLWSRCALHWLSNLFIHSDDRFYTCYPLSLAKHSPPFLHTQSQSPHIGAHSRTCSNIHSQRCLIGQGFVWMPLISSWDNALN